MNIALSGLACVVALASAVGCGTAVGGGAEVGGTAVGAGAEVGGTAVGAGAEVGGTAVGGGAAVVAGAHATRIATNKNRVIALIRGRRLLTRASPLCLTRPPL